MINEILLPGSTGVDDQYRHDSGLFNRSRTKSSTTRVREFQYADNNAIVNHTAINLQRSANEA